MNLTTEEKAKQTGIFALTQHYQFGFYNRSAECLQRGTD